MIYNIVANSAFLNDWGGEFFVSGLCTAFIMLFLSPLNHGFALAEGDDNTSVKAKNWVITVLSIIIFIALSVWLHNSGLIGF
ncbi:MAG: hypothetical protein E7454_07140 [Ruminococcaceae bacterium]|nr:hypothetical protein [Oscillospiraceae bacterium]